MVQSDLILLASCLYFKVGLALFRMESEHVLSRGNLSVTGVCFARLPAE